MANVNGSWNTIVESPMGKQDAVLTVDSRDAGTFGSYVHRHARVTALRDHC